LLSAIGLVPLGELEFTTGNSLFFSGRMAHPCTEKVREARATRPIFFWRVKIVQFRLTLFLTFFLRASPLLLEVIITSTSAWEVMHASPHSFRTAHPASSLLHVFRKKEKQTGIA
jgi:hypothetical protein